MAARKLLESGEGRARTRTRATSDAACIIIMQSSLVRAAPEAAPSSSSVFIMVVLLRCNLVRKALKKKDVTVVHWGFAQHFRPTEKPTKDAETVESRAKIQN